MFVAGSSWARAKASSHRSAHPRPSMGQTYRNPVVLQGADPGVLRVGKKYYLATTGGDSTGPFVIQESSDLRHWKKVGNILTKSTLPAWMAPSGNFWAPEIHQIGPHKFVAVFTADDRHGNMCIGVATSSSPAGPFTATSKPLVQGSRLPGKVPSAGPGGVIDPTFFRDSNGKQYVYWKVNSNAAHPRVPTTLWGAQVSAEGTRVVGKPRKLLVSDRPWEHGIIEGPEMMKHGNRYYLFYAAGYYDTSTYCEGVASAASPLGDFHKHDHGQILRSDKRWIGPGHGENVQTPRGQDWFVYHAQPRGRSGGKYPREILLDRMRWKNGWPVINGGSPSWRPKSAPN